MNKIKIVSIKSLGIRKVCDMEMPTAHNFILENGSVAHNCSHSVSYSYVAYACMYLKTKYPLDWWKSVLSNADKSEVAAKFWKYVKGFVRLPDINISGEDYKIVDESVVAPIGLINGIGEKAYQQLVAQAPYASLYDFVKIHLAKREAKHGNRSAVTTGVVRKLVVAGVLDSLFEPDLAVEQKLYEIEKLYAEIRKTRAKPIPEEYVGITQLGRYLAKKELIKVYSEDLRPTMLPSRGGAQVNENIWKTQDNVFVIDGDDILFYKERARQGLGIVGKLSCIAYIIKEETKQYKNKTKQMTKLAVDAGGTFYEEVLWPSRDQTEAETGFANIPVLLVYESDMDNFRLREVRPMMNKGKKKESYNIN